MRLWSLHPKYLDSQGLVALWREGLLAQAVLAGQTRGYLNHPQLARFKLQADPLAAVGAYLWEVHAESVECGYKFDGSKLPAKTHHAHLTVTTGQMAYEWSHLLRKLSARSPELYEKWRHEEVPESHGMFDVIDGDIESWEKF